MIIDIHFHMGGVENDDDIFISEKMMSQPTIKLMKYYLKMKKGVANNESALEWSIDNIKETKKVEKVVALAFDWVYNDNGEKDVNNTHYRVSNSFIYEQVQNYPEKILFGASVNPYRSNATKRLDEVKNMGAVLVKLIPSSQCIHLYKEKSISLLTDYFYQLKELNLPLLCHCGVEHTIPTATDQVCDRLEGILNPSFECEEKQGLNGTSKIKLALDCGVKVIVAHCGLPIYEKDGLQDYWILKELMENEKYDDQLFADLSGFITPASSY